MALVHLSATAPTLGLLLNKLCNYELDIYDNIILQYNFFKPETKKELKEGVNLWCSNKQEAIKKYGDIGLWDTSKIIDMRQLFYSKKYFNDDISNWNVSNVTNMNYMFCTAKKFNKPLNDWNVSNVTSMDSMFKNTSSFNQSLDNWNVSNVKSMNDMFWGAISFNQPLNDWDVSNVTYMTDMFNASGMLDYNKP